MPCITVYAYFLDTEAEFFTLAVAVGLVQGGVQSLSRSLFGRLVPEGKNAEFFGFYNMMGKFATVLGPLLIAVVAALTHNERASILSLVVAVRDRRSLCCGAYGSHRQPPDVPLEGRDLAGVRRRAEAQARVAATASAVTRAASSGRSRAHALRIVERTLAGARVARPARACGWRAARRAPMRSGLPRATLRRSVSATQMIQPTMPSANAQPRCCQLRRVDAELAAAGRTARAG